MKDKRESLRGREGGVSVFGGAHGVLFKAPHMSLQQRTKNNPTTPNFDLVNELSSAIVSSVCR